MPLLACVNLFGVVLGLAPRATMRFAPDGPKNGHSLEDLFLDQVCRQAGESFTSSIFSRRKTRWVIRKQNVELVVQVGEPANPESKALW
jgi:hypothetical protein